MFASHTHSAHRRLSVTALMLLLATALLGVVASGAPARAADGPTWQVRWSLNPTHDIEELSRVFDTDEDGHLDAAPDLEQRLGDILNPQVFSLHVDVCFLPTGFSSIDWSLSRPGEAPQPVVTSTTCATDLVLPDKPYPQPREYDVTATVHWPAGDDQTYSDHVRVQNIFMVGLGDSYGSGEGNPTNIDGKEWDNERCHRSRASGQEIAARMLDQLPGTTVTFLHVACSGAKALTGILEEYAGLVAREPKLPPQISQVAEFVDASQGVEQNLPKRWPDLVVTSIGGNDAGFADVVKTCLKPNYIPIPASVLPPWFIPIPTSACQDGGIVEEKFNPGIAALEGLYQNIADAVKGANPSLPALCNPDDTCKFLITEYPDGATDSNGDTCSFHGPGFTESEFQWVIDVMVPTLNGKIAEEATDHGWVYVDGIRDNFVGHGICADDDWLRDIFESMDVQGFGDINGAFHPDWAGHLFGYAPEIFEKARNSLGFPSELVYSPTPLYGSTGAPAACDSITGDGNQERFVAAPATDVSGLGLAYEIERQINNGSLPTARGGSNSCSSLAIVRQPAGQAPIELRTGRPGCPDSPQPCGGSNATSTLLRFPTFDANGSPVVIRTEADVERASGDDPADNRRQSSADMFGTTAFIAVPAAGSTMVEGEVVVDLTTVAQARGADASSEADFDVEVSSVIPDPDCGSEGCWQSLTTPLVRADVSLRRYSCAESDQYPHGCRTGYGLAQLHYDTVEVSAYVGEEQAMWIDEEDSSPTGSAASMVAVRDGLRNPMAEIRLPYSVPAGAVVTVRVSAGSYAYVSPLCTSNINDFACDAQARSAATINFDPDLATGVVLPLIGFQRPELPTDIVKPVVTSSITGPAGSNGWFTGPVELTISATDEAGGSGVDSLTYRVSTADPVTVDGPTVVLPFSENGIRTVTYSATDGAGNLSESGSASIKIDPLPPTISVAAIDGLPISPGATIPTDLQCADTLSGVATCHGPATLDTSTPGSHTATFTASDAAGNTATRTVDYVVIAPPPPPPPPPITDRLSLTIPELGFSVDGSVVEGGFTITRNASGQPIAVTGTATIAGPRGGRTAVTILAARVLGVWVGTIAVSDPSTGVNVAATTLSRTGVSAVGTNGATGTFTVQRPTRTITWTVTDLA